MTLREAIDLSRREAVLDTLNNQDRSILIEFGQARAPVVRPTLTPCSLDEILVPYLHDPTMESPAPVVTRTISVTSPAGMA